MLKRLKDLFKPADARPAVYTIGNEPFYWRSSGRPEDLIQKVKNWVYVCIDRNAAACAQTPLRLYQTKKQNKYKSRPADRNAVQRIVSKVYLDAVSDIEELVEHPLLDILKRPNPVNNLYELLNITVSYLEAIGNAFWYLEIENNQVLNIWPLLSQFVSIRKIDNEIYYKYQHGGKQMEFTAEQIIHFKYPSLTDPYLGTSPLQACEQAADLYDFMNRSEISLMKNGGIPDAVIQFPPDAFISEEEERRILTKYKQFQGPDRRGKLSILTGGAEIKPVGFAPKDMNYLQGRKSAVEEICGVFGVPLSFVKIQEISRANAWASLDLWAQQVIRPKLVVLENKLNERLVPLFDDSLLLMFDNPRPPDEEFRLRQIETRLRVNYTSINEERAIDGFPPVEWGETPVNPLSQTIQAETPTAEETSEKSYRPAEPPQYKENAILITHLVLFYKEMISEIGRKLKKLEEKAVVNDVISTVFDNKHWTKRLEETLSPFLRGIMINRMIEEMSKIKPDGVINASSPEVRRALEKRKGKIATLVSNSERKIRKLIEQGINEGMGAAKIADLIKDNFNTLADAERVARSETIWAHNEGIEQAWKQSGVVAYKVWDSSGDDRSCPFCRSMHGKKVSLDSDFIQKGDTLTVKDTDIELDYENIAHPPLHPNCRCAIVPVIKE